MSRITKALEKAMAARESGGEYSGPDFVQIIGKGDGAFEVRESPAAKDINPEYTKTRVVHIDPDYLKGQRIVSILNDNIVADQIKILRTQVMEQMAKIKGNTLLVTSANPKEGKTLIALNLAISIAQEVGHTVLFVEADMRTSSMEQKLGLKMNVGLSDLLMNSADIPDALINPGIEKLVILPAGSPVKTSAELLGSPKMEGIIREMKTRYPDRFIIFDGPPILSFADPLVFSRFVDGILLVVEAEKTTKKDIARVMELLKGKPVIGAIYNKAKG